MNAKLTKKCSKLFHMFTIKSRKVILCIKSKYLPVFKDEKETAIKETNYSQIGMSICNPLDKFDEKLGKKIAEAKADHKRNLHIRQIYIPNEVDKNFGLLTYLLKEQEELIRLEPESFIKALTRKQKK